MTRRVASKGGMEYYDLPMDAIITADIAEMARSKAGKGAPKGSTKQSRIGRGSPIKKMLAPKGKGEAAGAGDSKKVAPVGKKALKAATSPQDAPPAKVAFKKEPSIAGSKKFSVADTEYSAPEGSKVYDSPTGKKVAYVVTPDGDVHVFGVDGEVELDEITRAKVKAGLVEKADQLTEAKEAEAPKAEAPKAEAKAEAPKASKAEAKASKAEAKASKAEAPADADVAPGPPETTKTSQIVAKIGRTIPLSSENGRLRLEAEYTTPSGKVLKMQMLSQRMGRHDILVRVHGEKDNSVASLRVEGLNSSRLTIDHVVVSADMERQGLATAMLAFAQRETNFHIAHSDYRTKDGDAWEEKTRELADIMPTTLPKYDFPDSSDPSSRAADLRFEAHRLKGDANDEDYDKNHALAKDLRNSAKKKLAEAEELDRGVAADSKNKKAVSSRDIPDHFEKPADHVRKRYSAESEAVADQTFDKASKAEPAITEDLFGLAEANKARLIGLPFRLKDTESLSRKIEDEREKSGLSAEEVAAQLSDTVRYTMEAKIEEYAATIQAVLDDLRTKKMQLRVKNSWVDKKTPYRGVNVAVTTPEGLTYELQFHTPESFHVKDKLNHPLYEKARDSNTPREESVRLDAEMLANSEAMTVPPDIASVR